MNAVETLLPMDEIEAFCRRWKIVEFAVFGSVLRDDFRPDSDIDALVSFAEDASWSLLDHIGMEIELGEVVGRKVDLMTRRSIERSENWLLRERIIESAQIIYGT